MTALTGFHVTLLIGRRLYWEVRPDGILEVPEVAREAPVLLSFDVHDHRLATPARWTSRRARQGFMREWGEQVRVVNRARDLAAVYGRDPAHALARPAGCRLVPGLQLMDQLAQARHLPLAGRLLGLKLGAHAGSGRRLVLLFAYDEQAELVRFQEAANPPSLDYLVEEFSRSLPVPPAVTEPAWFDQGDVAAVLAASLPYPDEETWWEVPQRRWWQAAWQANAALVLMALCWAAWAGWDGWTTRQDLAGTQSHIAQLQGEGDAALRHHARALAWSDSADLAHAFQDAEALWRPGTRVQVLATPKRIDYALKLAAAPVPAGHTGLPAELPHPLRASLDGADARLPPGLRALDPALGGDLNAYYLRFRRETPLPPIAAVAGTEP